MKNAPNTPMSPAHEPAQVGHPMAPAITPVPGWPQEPWDIEIPNERIVALYGTPVPGDLFAASVAAGFESLLAQKTEKPAGEEGLAFKALVQDESDEVLEAAVLAAQACAYQLAGSKTLSIMVAARFMCLVLMHRLTVASSNGIAGSANLSCAATGVMTLTPVSCTPPAPVRDWFVYYTCCYEFKGRQHQTWSTVHISQTAAPVGGGYTNTINAPFEDYMYYYIWAPQSFMSVPRQKSGVIYFSLETAVI